MEESTPSVTPSDRPEAALRGELTPLVPLHLVDLPLEPPELHTDTGVFFQGDLANWRIGATLGLAVAAKATYGLAPGPLRPHHVQLPLDRHERQWDDDETRSVAVMSDVVPYKARPEVIVVGSTFRPRDARGGDYVARLAVGPMERTLRVHPDRFVQAGGRIVTRDDTSRVPMRWERAPGGPGTQNPAGLPVTRDRPGRLPNFELEGTRVGMPGFGAIPCVWPTRLSEAGPATAHDARGMMKTRCLSTEVSPGFFNCAPRGQQLESLHAGETVVLEGLSRTGNTIELTLPNLRPYAWVVEDDVAVADTQLKLDTMVIDTQRNLVTLTWRAFYGYAELDGRVRVLLSDRKTDNPWARSKPLVRGIIRNRSTHPPASGPLRDADAIPPPSRLPSDLPPPGSLRGSDPSLSLRPLSARTPSAPRHPNAPPIRDLPPPPSMRNLPPPVEIAVASVVGSAAVAGSVVGGDDATLAETPSPGVAPDLAEDEPLAIADDDVEIVD